MEEAGPCAVTKLGHFTKMSTQQPRARGSECEDATAWVIFGAAPP